MYLAHERFMCKSIYHRGGDCTSCRMRIALGENHRRSGVNLKARVTWGAVSNILCTGSPTPVDKPDYGQKFSAFGGAKKAVKVLCPLG